MEEINVSEVIDVLLKVRNMLEEADAEIDRLKKELNCCRNELCLHCGQYKTAHLGSCDGCRWKDV